MLQTSAKDYQRVTGGRGGAVRHGRDMLAAFGRRCYLLPMSDLRERMEADLAWRERRLRAAHVLDRHEALVRRLNEAGGDAFAALWAVVRFLAETGVPRDRQALLMAVLGRIEDDAQRDNRKAAGKGGRTYPFTKVVVFATAAATVTALHQRRRVPVPEAVRTVARAAGVDQAELKTFREQLSRRKHALFTQSSYDSALAELRRLTDEEFDRSAVQITADLGAICANPSLKAHTEYAI